jgi:hypothetical protein
MEGQNYPIAINRHTITSFVLNFGQLEHTNSTYQKLAIFLYWAVLGYIHWKGHLSCSNLPRSAGVSKFKNLRQTQVFSASLIQEQYKSPSHQVKDFHRFF